MPVTIKNTNADGRFSMALKIGDKIILPGEEATVEELEPVLEVATDSKMKLLALQKQEEARRMSEARKENASKAQYVWDPWKRKPCCMCPPCAVFGGCIDDCRARCLLHGTQPTAHAVPGLPPA